jgi:hypothetical protein
MMSGEMRMTTIPALLALLTGTVCMTFAQGLDYETYKKNVEPIFLKKRPGHARCVVCHEANNSAFRLQPLAEGATKWTEEQSRKNFESVLHLVTPGDPSTSKLLIHPLSPEAGGDKFHGGGRQFASKSDPEWKAIADWVDKKK